MNDKFTVCYFLPIVELEYAKFPAVIVQTIVNSIANRFSLASFSLSVRLLPCGKILAFVGTL